jgi:translation initiation factor 2B subunit (eIF-2B alpha/beta/delta family)
MTAVALISFVGWAATANELREQNEKMRELTHELREADSLVVSHRMDEANCENLARRLADKISDLERTLDMTRICAGHRSPKNCIADLEKLAKQTK